VENGRLNAADGVPACQSACENNAECTGVDYNPTAAVGQRCWFSGPWSGQMHRGYSYGITHYVLDRTCGTGGNKIKCNK